jgi:quercetin dioxygenase-like cupin family protein
MAEIVRVNAKELRSFDEKKFNPKTVYQTREIKAVLAYFKAGQFIPAHTPKVDVILCILEGEAEILAGDEKLVAKANDLVVVPKGLKRGVKALTELTVLHIVHPPPSEEDHKEVHEKIARGEFE